MALKFLKIDLIRVKKFWYVLFLPLFILFFFLGKDSHTPALFGLCYCLFIGMIFSSFPANSEVKGERGFLQMLPAKPGSDIKGHFLFAAFCIALFTVISCIILTVVKLIRPGFDLFEISGRDMSGFYPIAIGFALLVAGIELLLLTIFRYKSLQVQQLLRIIPAFIFFFGMSSVSDRAQEMRLPELSYGLGKGCMALFIACIVIFVVLAEVSSRITAAKEG